MAPKITTYVDKKSGMWHVNVQLPGGARKRPALGLKGTEDPTNALANFVQHVLPGIVRRTKATPAKSPDAPGKRLQDLADWYIDTHLPFLGLGDKTIGNYRSTIQGFIAFCSAKHIARAQQVSPRIVQEWQMQLAASRPDKTVSRDQVLAIRRWLNQCEESGELKDLPMMKWVIPRKTKSRRFRAIPHETVTAWVDGLTRWRPALGAVAAWVAATGWRIGDVIDLRVVEVDLDRNVIDRSQLKTKNALDYPLSPALREMAVNALSRHKSPKPMDTVFLNHKGHRWQYPALVKVLKNFQDSHWTGEHITFRDLRKSFGSRLAMQGCPPNVLQELMGHADVTMTLTFYVDVDVERMRQWSVWHTENPDTPRSSPSVSPEAPE